MLTSLRIAFPLIIPICHPAPLTPDRRRRRLADQQADLGRQLRIFPYKPDDLLGYFNRRVAAGDQGAGATKLVAQYFERASLERPTGQTVLDHVDFHPLGGQGPAHAHRLVDGQTRNIHDAGLGNALVTFPKHLGDHRF